tara:strand:+ start:56 stop:220 length:165 start_codon:yes stop_codon:yes gene_type:complete
MEEKNKAAQSLAKLSHKRLDGLTAEQRKEYYKAVKQGVKGKALKALLVPEIPTT